MKATFLIEVLKITYDSSYGVEKVRDAVEAMYPSLNSYQLEDLSGLFRLFLSPAHASNVVEAMSPIDICLFVNMFDREFMEEGSGIIHYEVVSDILKRCADILLRYKYLFLGEFPEWFKDKYLGGNIEKLEKRLAKKVI